MKLLAIPLLIAAVGSSLFSSLIPASAQTWTQTSAPITNWTAIASSADGVKLVAVASGGAIYTSTNSGASWAPATNAPDQAWRAVASSANGNKLIAAVRGGGIYRSVDSGLTWTQTGASSNAWISITSSADGNKLAAVASIFPPPDFFTSSDSGTTWITNGSPYDRWLAIAASADGNTLVACGGLGTILASTNAGNSWTTNDIVGGTSSSAASSADGSRLVVTGIVAGGGRICLSTNSGLAWTQTNAPSVGPVALSADGTKLVAASSVSYSNNFPIYVSTDFGVTWTTNFPPGTNYWTGVVSSADGGKLAVIASGPGGGGIWTLQTAPAPQMNTTPANGNLTLSWIIPSTNFVLEQNLDLTSMNWTDVTNMPVLNLTNLQDEVTLPLTNGSGFYRLATP